MEINSEHNRKPKENKYGRRKFLKASVLGGVSFLVLPPDFNNFQARKEVVKYDISLDSPVSYFDGNYCWVQVRVGIVPGIENFPLIVMTMSKLDLNGSDVFKATYGMQSNDLGKTWTKAGELDSLSPRYEMIDGVKSPVSIGGFQPCWHKVSGKLLGTGHTVVYTPEWKVALPRPRNTSYSVYDPVTGTWEVWKKMEVPDDERFYNFGSGCSQRFDLKDGTILLPVSFRSLGKNSGITVCWCSFDGTILKYLKHGDEIYFDDDTRGLFEPSLTCFNSEYFLTIRHDKCGFVTRSRDGLNFSPIQTWKFDDGSDLGNYNTQQHWVTHSDGLFLVYTRRGADNDHVFRHRAPLFIAQVDTERLCIIRETEQILVPERGARLGNFGVTDISEDETWVTVSEWMQPRGCEKYGSDGSVFIARIHWDKPNKLFSS